MLIRRFYQFYFWIYSCDATCMTLSEIKMVDRRCNSLDNKIGCGILKMVGPKMQDFCPRIDLLKGNHCILRIRGAPVCQKVPKLYYQSQFSMSKIDGIFSKNLRISI